MHDPLHSVFGLLQLVCSSPLVVVHLMLEIAHVGHQLQDLRLQASQGPPVPITPSREVISGRVAAMLKLPLTTTNTSSTRIRNL
jgi:hypothetical protein